MAWNRLTTFSMIGWIFPSLLYAGVPGAARVALSAKWRYAGVRKTCFETLILRQVPSGTPHPSSMRSMNPRRAVSSWTVIFSQLSYFSCPLHSRAYLLFCSTMYSSSAWVKNKKAPRLEHGTTTCGPICCSNGSTWTLLSVDDHVMFDELGLDEGNLYMACKYWSPFQPLPRVCTCNLAEEPENKAE